MAMSMSLVMLLIVSQAGVVAGMRVRAKKLADSKESTWNVFVEVIHVAGNLPVHTQTLVCPRSKFAEDSNKRFQAGLATYGTPVSETEWHRKSNDGQPCKPKMSATGNLIVHPGCIPCFRFAYGGPSGGLSASSSSTQNQTAIDNNRERCSGFGVRHAFFQQGIEEGVEMYFQGGVSASKHYVGTTQISPTAIRDKACLSDCGVEKFTKHAYWMFTNNCNHATSTILQCIMGLPKDSPGALPKALLVGSSADCTCFHDSMPLLDE